MRRSESCYGSLTGKRCVHLSERLVTGAKGVALIYFWLNQEGSTFIREHVFEKILAAETELASKDEADIIPKNYDFVLLGKDGCASERCWHLSMKPKRNDKYLLNGEIWLDATDYGICRIHGSPSKRVSLWVSKVDIDKRLRRINGIWLADRIESSSNIRFAGNVRMQIEYAYDSVTVVRPTAGD
jgi:hypothetical protein